MKKIAYFIFGLGLLLISMPITANALSVSSQLFMNETNLLSDNSADFLMNSDTTVDNPLDTTLDMDDTLWLWFNVGTVEDLTGSGGTNVIGSSGVNELTGIGALKVTSKLPAAGGGSLYDYVFGPDPNFETLYGAGSMMVLFEDTNVNYTRLGAEDGPGAVAEWLLFDTARDGTHFWTFGFDGAANLDWQATNAEHDVAVAGATPVPGSAGDVNFALNRLDTTGSGPPLGWVPGTFGGLVNLNGSGSVLGTGGVVTSADVFDNFDLACKPIPEPATMLLLGSGLIGLAGFGRKKRFFKKN